MAQTFPNCEAALKICAILGCEHPTIKTIPLSVLTAIDCSMWSSSPVEKTFSWIFRGWLTEIISLAPRIPLNEEGI